MPLGGWEIAGVLFRVLFYLSLVVIIGATCAPWYISDISRRFLKRNLIQAIAGSVVGFYSVLGYFLTQIGGVKQAGLGGMLDWPLISFYQQLPVGAATLLRLSGFLLLFLVHLAALVHVTRLMRPPSQRFRVLLHLCTALCLALIGLSLQLVGHLAELEPALQVVLLVHVLAACFWLGALLPLELLTWDGDQSLMQEALQKFSNLALVVVALLLAGGGLMSLSLVSTPGDLLATPWGRALCIKLSLVLVLLGLAALNKFYLVPALARQGNVEALRFSIRGEMLAGTLILVVTAWLSGVVGPPGH